MLYTEDQFERVTALDLLERPQSWMSGNARENDRYVAHKIIQVFWRDQFIHIRYEVREGVQYTTSSGPNRDEIEQVDFTERPFAIIAADRIPSTEILVLKREFEPVQEEERK